MIVIADTSPLNYLIQLQQDALLPQLYSSVAVPPSVVRELSDMRAPQDVRAWIAAQPTWLEVLAVRGPIEPELFHLDEGERDAIQLAVECHADLLLMDEIEGRGEAAKRNLRTTGILGILRAAHPTACSS